VATTARLRGAVPHRVARVARTHHRTTRDEPVVSHATRLQHGAVGYWQMKRVPAALPTTRYRALLCVARASLWCLRGCLRNDWWTFSWRVALAGWRSTFMHNGCCYRVAALCRGRLRQYIARRSCTNSIVYYRLRRDIHAAHYLTRRATRCLYLLPAFMARGFADGLYATALPFSLLPRFAARAVRYAYATVCLLPYAFVTAVHALTPVLHAL